MKNFISFNSGMLIKKTLILIVVISLTYSCKKWWEQDLDYETSFYSDTDLSITQYINSKQDSFSILNNILDTTKLSHLFKTYGDYTFLAPTDEAFNEYFQEQGKSSYKDFKVEELIELINYHVFETRYLIGSFNLGLVETKTLSSDYMISSLSYDGSSVLLNKSSTIVITDIILPNGILHGVDKVIENPRNSIYDWLKENEKEYTILLEAFEKTGLNELIKVNTDSLNDSTYKPEFYTCFFTPDNIFANEGIYSFADLADLLSPNDTKYTDSSNALRNYIGSQIIDEPVSISDATEEYRYFGTQGDASLKFGLQGNTADVVLNSQTEDFPEGLDINEFKSNNLALNGIVHVMDTMYQITSAFQRVPLVFNWLQVPGIPYDSLWEVAMEIIELGGKLKEKDEIGKDYQFWPRAGDGDHIPFPAPWLTLNKPYSALIRADHHLVSSPTGRPILLRVATCEDLFDVTRKLPFILPGKYRLIHGVKLGPTRPTVQHHFNGKPIGGIINLGAEGNGNADIDLGIIEITADQTEHFFRIEGVTSGSGYYLTIEFIPVD